MYVGNVHAMMWTQLVTGEIFMETLVSVMKETAKQCMIDTLMTSVQVRFVYKKIFPSGLIFLFPSAPILIFPNWGGNRECKKGLGGGF